MIKVSVKGNMTGALNAMIEALEDKVKQRYEEVGKQAVEVAKETGSYHDVTGRLRASNKYEADKDHLTLYNDAPYAKEVESRGKIVLSSAILFAEAELNNPNR